MCLNVPVGGGEEGPGVVEDESEFEFAGGVVGLP